MGKCVQCNMVMPPDVCENIAPGRFKCQFCIRGVNQYEDNGLRFDRETERQDYIVFLKRLKDNPALAQDFKRGTPIQ